mgnify:CR=1 FL=1
MQIILRGPAAGYEAEHTARLFFPDAEKAENLPQDSDFVLAQSHLCTDTILLRLHGRLYWKIALRPQGAEPAAGGRPGGAGEKRRGRRDGRGWEKLD